MSPSPTPVTAQAAGKINLGLWVGGLDAAGYHPVLSAFQAVDIWEKVTVCAANTLGITMSGSIDASGLPLDRGNIAWAAAVLLAEHTGHSTDIHITIEKSVPIAGGMAGGSADAAATLLALFGYWQLDAKQVPLDTIAAQLGADVAFSLRGGSAIGRGRGEVLEALSVDQPLHLVVVPADFPLATAEVYRQFDLLPGDPMPPATLPEGFLAAWQSGDAHTLAPLMHNDLEAAACLLHPELTDTRAAVTTAGALRAMVSGSGPTVFGLASGSAHAAEIAQALRDAGYPARITQSVLSAQ